MQPSEILKSSLLDILYDGKNKSYGSYALRTTYTRRMLWALSSMILLTTSVSTGIYLQNLLSKKNIKSQYQVTDVALSDVREKQQTPPPLQLPPPPAHLMPPKIEIKSFTVPRIVEHVEEKKQVKEQDELQNTTVGKIDQEGIKAPDIVNPPKVDKDSKVVSGPVVEEDNRVFTKVEIEAAFPGGDEKWNDYVRQTITAHMDELVSDGNTGTCTVQFIVSKDGVVSDVSAVTMQGTKLAEIAVNAIRRGPRWIPAEQNGRKVNAFRRQNIRFIMAEQP